MTLCCNRLRSLITPLLRQEIHQLFAIAWPVISTNVLNFIILTESLIICGHLTQVELDGAALANSIINGIGLSFGNGLVSACDTLFSQCYGSEFKTRVGLYLQKSLFIIGLVPFLVLPLYFNILPILLALGQNEQVSVLAADYMLYFSPGLFFHYMYKIQSRYLQNQNRVMPPLVVAIIGNVFNLLSQYLCIYVFQLGFIYSAICQGLTFVVMCIIMLSYIMISKVYVSTWSGWQIESLLDWGLFLRLALPGMGMLSLEVMSWEIGTFVAGAIGPAELGAQSILYQTETCTFMLATGIATAVNIRVGQQLGANNPQAARRVWIAGVCSLIFIATIVCIVFILARDIIPTIFTNDLSVISITKPIIPLLGIFLYFDGLAGVCAGALRGCGRQMTGVVLVFIAYYVLGLTIGIPLAIYGGLRVVGLWIGLVIGISIVCPGYMIILSCQNWQQQAELASRRVQAAAATKRNFHLSFQSQVHRPSSSSSDERQPLLWQQEFSNAALDTHCSNHAATHSSNSNQIHLSMTRSDSTIRSVYPDRLRKAICMRGICVVSVAAIFIAGIFARCFLPQHVISVNSTNITL